MHPGRSAVPPDRPPLGCGCPPWTPGLVDAQGLGHLHVAVDGCLDADGVTVQAGAEGKAESATNTALKTFNEIFNECR